MSETILEIKNHLVGKLHAGSALRKVSNINHAFERAALNVLSSIKPLDSERNQPLSALVYDDVYNMPLPTDFGWPIDLAPSGDRLSYDIASHRLAQDFDLRKAILNKTVSIEGNDGTKFLRVNWRNQAPIVIDAMDATTGWSIVGTASSIGLQKVYKISGSSSLEFNVAATGDGIQKTTIPAINLTDKDEIADVFIWLEIKNATDLANINSVTAVWGNDLTTKYLTSPAITAQADGTAFKVGWNRLAFLRDTATATGTLVPSAIDSFKLTFNIDAPITNLRVDSIVFAIGRPFDLKYYSKYSFKSAAGVYLQRPTDENGLDTVVFSDIALLIFIEEAVKECAMQIEGADSRADIAFADSRLYGNPDSPDPILRIGLYARYRGENPSQIKKPVGSWAHPRNPNFFRR